MLLRPIFEIAPSTAPTRSSSVRRPVRLFAVVRCTARRDVRHHVAVTSPISCPESRSRRRGVFQTRFDEGKDEILRSGDKSGLRPLPRQGDASPRPPISRVVDGATTATVGRTRQQAARPNPVAHQVSCVDSCDAYEISAAATERVTRWTERRV